MRVPRHQQKVFWQLSLMALSLLLLKSLLQSFCNKCVAFPQTVNYNTLLKEVSYMCTEREYAERNGTSVVL